MHDMDKWVEARLDMLGVPPSKSRYGGLRHEILADLECSNDCLKAHWFGCGEEGVEDDVYELRDQYLTEVLGIRSNETVYYDVSW